eukprot:1175437-Rhodomonas_salina.1
MDESDCSTCTGSNSDPGRDRDEAADRGSVTPPSLVRVTLAIAARHLKPVRALRLRLTQSYSLDGGSAARSLRRLEQPWT